MKTEHIPAGFRVTVESVGYDGGEDRMRNVFGLSVQEVKDLRELIEPYRVSGEFIKHSNARERIELQTTHLKKLNGETQAIDLCLIGYNGLPRLVTNCRVSLFLEPVDIHHYEESDF